MSDANPLQFKRADSVPAYRVEEYIDATDDSDQSERSTDGSDDGESLADFIADDTETTVSEDSGDGESVFSGEESTDAMDDLEMMKDALESLEITCMKLRNVVERLEAMRLQ